MAKAPPRHDPPGAIAWHYSPAELRADAAIHGLGIALALIGAIAFALTMPKTTPAEAAAVAVYLCTLVFSVVASAAYNVWPVSPAKWLLRRFDHSAIYLLIAGTYTPFLVKIGMGGLLGFVWSVAALGVCLKIVCPGRFDRVSIGLYLALGWSGIVVIDQLLQALSPSVLGLIGAGGLIYSLGVIFHVWETLRFQNAIWHGFVLTAAIIHYAAIWSAVCVSGLRP